MLTEKRDLRGGTPVWADSPHSRVQTRSRLQQEHCDVAVVGGGVSGALTALALCRTGLDVVVVDRREPGSGSTLASTAMIQFEIDTPLTKLADQIGARKAERAYLRSYAAVAGLGALVHELGISANWIDRQALYLAGPEMGFRGLKAEAVHRAKIGLPSEFLPGAELRDIYGIDRTGAIVSGGAAELNPIQLTAGCLRAARRLGCRVYGGQEVVRVEASARSVVLRTGEGGEISCRRAVFATGYEVVDGLPRDRFDITSSWAIATKPIPPAEFWPGRCLIWEAADPYLYLRSTPDNRIVAGGEDSGLKDADRRDAAVPAKAEKILRSVERLLPGRKLEIDYAWAGAFAESPTGLPLFEEIDGLPNCLAILGCGGNGITFSYVASEIASQWAKGRSDPDRDLFRAT
ncbi:MAG: FAD-binding oxidoreductase [Acidobacteria bacterium]|jgi:glycine/D-amino acid oxidase-like deaminating enzyme|nr:FAD-binding oxidoreductase [Acidobacteriota bacterium]